MRLPSLKVINNPTATLSTCLGKDNCTGCVLFVKNGGRCEGCTPKHKASLGRSFSNCYQECDTCTGFKVDVPGVCCRSPRKDLYMTAVTRGAADWNKPTYNFKKRPVLSFNDKAVFYISSGGVNTIAPGKTLLVPATQEVVAVNLTRVWGGNGFYSKDLKDYLHLSPKTKLVLMTMCLDDLLERGWNKEFYADPNAFRAVGLDAWMPLSFSAYPEDAHMHQYYQLLRTLHCTEKSEAWWVTGDHRMSGLRTDDLIQAAAEKIPQMVFNMQFSMKDEWFKYHLLLTSHYHKLLPKHVAFWFVGATTPMFFQNIRNVCGDRSLYFVSAKPLYLASKGQSLQLGGGSIPSTLSKQEVLFQNIEMLSSMVKAYG